MKVMRRRPVAPRQRDGRVPCAGGHLMSSVSTDDCRDRRPRKRQGAAVRTRPRRPDRRGPCLQARFVSPPMPAAALRDADILWITYDTPVDDDDARDVELVIARVERRCCRICATARSCSSPRSCRLARHGDCASLFAAPLGRGLTSPTRRRDLRLGRPIAAFVEPDRIVVGVRDATRPQRLEPLLQPISRSSMWMSRRVGRDDEARHQRLPRDVA